MSQIVHNLIFCSFVQAPHSRERLFTTRYMLTLCLTYQQVIPGFLDFVFPFGKQVHEREFHFGGFRYQTRILASEQGVRVPELGWSGRDYRLCYNLRSVEQACGGGEPWSIRQAAFHHSFDVESGQASWLVIKANEVLQKRIKSATGSRGLSKICSFESVARAFASTLATHLMFCEWSVENWRWYINFLEETMQETTRRTLSPIVRTPTSPTKDFSAHSIAFSEKAKQDDRARRPPPPPLAIDKVLPGFTYVEDGMIDPPQSPYAPPAPGTNEKRQDFSFTDLQRLQNTEEKANAAKLILNNNISVYSDLRNYYKTVSGFQGWPCELSLQSNDDILRFEQDLSSIEKEMHLQLSRIATLLQLIADRKSLVSLSPLAPNDA